VPRDKLRIFNLSEQRFNGEHCKNVGECKHVRVKRGEKHNVSFVRNVRGVSGGRASAGRILNCGSGTDDETRINPQVAKVNRLKPKTAPRGIPQFVKVAERRAQIKRPAAKPVRKERNVKEPNDEPNKQHREQAGSGGTKSEE
jgi:hypothetical protein